MSPTFHVNGITKMYKFGNTKKCVALLITGRNSGSIRTDGRGRSSLLRLCAFTAAPLARFRSHALAFSSEPERSRSSSSAKFTDWLRESARCTAVGFSATATSGISGGWSEIVDY